MFNDFAVWMIF